MAQTISPFFRSPFTDITGGMISHQLLDRCAKQEELVMDCLEDYGLDRGLRECKDLIEDFKECQTMTKQLKRFMVSIVTPDENILSCTHIGNRGNIK